MPKAAGGWRMTATSGSSSAGRDRRAPLTGPASPSRGGGGFPFVGGTKTTLRRVLSETGVVLTAEAQAQLDALPETFLDFVAVAANDPPADHLEAPEAAQIEAEAA